MRERGLRIESPDGNIDLPRVSAAGDTSEVGPVDAVLFTVKLYDTESAIVMLPPLIGPRTVVIPFQNGVESVERLARAVGREHVAGGTCYVSAVIEAPGVIRHTAMGRLIFGPVDTGAAGAPVRDALAALRAACDGAGFEAILSDHIMTDIWSKFARLTVFSGMTTVTRCPLGAIMSDPDLSAMMTEALHESFAVARAAGIALDETQIPAIIAANAAMPPGMKSSMLEDLERGRPLELPFLSGALVRIGSERGVATPIHRFIATVLKPYVKGSPSPAPH
jgi:2-dehydropantoate 2-reductase